MNLIAENITYHRKRMNMTQKEMAVHLNISAQAISKWEKGHTIPDLIMASKIANLFSISLDELVHGVVSNYVAKPKEIMHIYVHDRTEENTEITVNIPMDILRQVKASAQLNDIAGEEVTEYINMAVKMLRSGSKGLLIEVHEENIDILLEVKHYED